MNAMTHQGAILSLAVLSLTIFATSERVIGEETDRYDRVTVIPTGAHLRGPYSRQQLVVTGWRGNRATDLTRDASFASESPTIISTTNSGLITPVGDGEGVVRITAGEHSLPVSVRVSDGTNDIPVSLEEDVLPIFTRKGCNSGPCHGKQDGQNGFRLSLWAFEPDEDYESLVLQSRGRRVSASSPEESLLIEKATGKVPHGGGPRITPASNHYELLLDWVEQGFPRRTVGAPAFEDIIVYPERRQLLYGEKQQILVTARHSDGTERDVTHLADYMSTEDVVVRVDKDGLLEAGPLPGEATILVRYMGKMKLCTALIPLPDAPPAEFYTRLPRKNFIDDLVWKKLELLGLAPSEPCNDAQFLRRATLDVAGRLPTPDETRAFLADTSDEKRDRLADRLLDDPNFGDFWANKWADLLLPDVYRVGIKATLNFDAWLKEAFRRDITYAEFAREVITAKGSTFRQTPAVVFRNRRKPEEIVTMISQLFLGIRLDCARCHHHPFEVYSQKDFFSLAAFFSQIGRKGAGLSPPISGGEETIFVAPSPGKVHHPKTGEALAPTPLFGEIPEESPHRDLRDVLVDWMLEPENKFFPMVQVNRVWADLMGRGLVEPVDDLRTSNPASNDALLLALAESFRKNNYSIKHLLRTILSSHVYALSSLPAERNVADTRNYSRKYRQQLRAEVLLDAITEITDVPEEFRAMPVESRALQLWSRRLPAIFLDTFGRPGPSLVPPCERLPGSNVVQALHLMNSPRLHKKVTADGSRADQLARSDKTEAEIVEELYLLCYARFPNPHELEMCLAEFGPPPSPGGGAEKNEKYEEERITQRRVAAQDILWALLNTPEFFYKD